MKKTSYSLVLVAIATFAAFPVHAQIIQTNSLNNAATGGVLNGFSITPNLLQTSTLSSGDFTSSGGSSFDPLLKSLTPNWGFVFNGIIGASAVSNGPNPHQWTLTVRLPSSQTGYDLTQIDVLSSWDGSILNHYQNYDLAYATVAAPLIGDYTSLGNFSYTDAPDHPQALKTELTGTLPTNVKYLQFTFFSNVSGYDQATRSIEIFGAQAAVPEPSTWAMLVIGMGALAIGIRRRQLSAQV